MDARMKITRVFIIIILKIQVVIAWLGSDRTDIIHPRVRNTFSVRLKMAISAQNIMSPMGVPFDQLSENLGGKGRALSCWECYRKGVDPAWFFGSSQNDTPQEPIAEILQHSGWSREQLTHKGPELGEKSVKLINGMASPEKDVAQLSRITESKDGTTKLLLRMKDGLEVETVIIPWQDRGRSTLCISSQVGCRQGCTFCATGRMGIIRSLSAEEILVQMYYANKICRINQIFAIDNIVFMGMGEPADNADEVVKAAKTLVNPNMFGLTGRRVTISTVGPTPDSFLKLAAANVTLAWSVHATRQKVRNALVPTTKYSMEELRKGLLKALSGRSRALKSTMLEIALIDSINDSYEDAMHLVDFCKPIQQQASKLVVNLIPWNDISAPSGAASLFRQPSTDTIFRFQEILKDNGIRCYIRTTRGDEENAACGQLATKSRRNHKVMNQVV